MNELPREILIAEILPHLIISDFVNWSMINTYSNSYSSDIVIWQKMLETTGHCEFRKLLIRVSKSNSLLLFKTLYDVCDKDKSKNLLIDDDTYHLCISYFFLFDNLVAIDYIANIMRAKIKYALLRRQPEYRKEQLRRIEVLKDLFTVVFTDIDNKIKLKTFIERINYCFNDYYFIIDLRVVIEQVLVMHNDWYWLFNLLRYVDGLPLHSSQFFRAVMRTLVNRGVSETEGLKRIVSIENNWDTVLSDIVYANANNDLFAKLQPHLKKYYTNEPIQNKSRYIENCTRPGREWLDSPYTCFDPKEFFDIFGVKYVTDNIINAAKYRGYNKWAEKMNAILAREKYCLNC